MTLNMKHELIASILIYAYFTAGIMGGLFAYFAQKLSGPSKLFSHGKAANNSDKTISSSNSNNNIINRISSLTVSKHFFWHFYALGLILSLIYTKLQGNNWLPASLLAFQCLRRLIECFTIMPGGKDSQMHLIHYLIGLSYYPALLLSLSLQNTTINIGWIGLFIFASGLQSYCHWILGCERIKMKQSMKGCHRPLNHGIFKVIHSPHYFAELLIYTSIAGLQGFHPLSLLNLIWIVVILGVSAKNSSDWLVQRWKYKSHEEFCKYLMIPFLF